MTNSKYNSHTTPIFKKLQILSLEKMIIFELLMAGKKLNTKNMPTSLLEYYHYNNNSSKRTKLPQIRKHKSAKYNKSFLVKNIIHYQNLPTELKTQCSEATFKYKVKKYLIEHDRISL